jgi:hypothetical protein
MGNLELGDSTTFSEEKNEGLQEARKDIKVGGREGRKKGSIGYYGRREGRKEGRKYRRKKGRKVKKGRKA